METGTRDRVSHQVNTTDQVLQQQDMEDQDTRQQEAGAHVTQVHQTCALVA